MFHDVVDHITSRNFPEQHLYSRVAYKMDMNKYLGILRWSLQYNDGTSGSDAKPMDPERVKWLQEAMASQMVDPVDQLKELIKVLDVPYGEENKESYSANIVETLEYVKQWVENLDWASDLYKIGGYKSVVHLLSSHDTKVRAAACEVVGTVVQNNPQCQDWSMEMEVLPLLIENWSHPDETEQTKSLMAIGSLVRGHTMATLAFIKQFKGVSLLLESFTCSVNMKARKKAIFLLNYLVETIPAIKIASAVFLVETLNKTIDSDDIDIRENSIDCLTLVASDHNSRQLVSSEDWACTLSKLIIIKAAYSTDEMLIESIAYLESAIQSPFPNKQVDPTLKISN